MCLCVCTLKKQKDGQTDVATRFLQSPKTETGSRCFKLSFVLNTIERRHQKATTAKATVNSYSVSKKEEGDKKNTTAKVYKKRELLQLLFF